MKVAKWGNSLAVRLPRSLVDELALRDGDDVELTVVGERRLGLSRDRGREDALERIRSMRVPLPAGYRFDRGEIYERRGFTPNPDEPDGE